MTENDLNRAAKQLERIGKAATQRVKKSTQRLAMDELNILSEQQFQSEVKLETAKKKANQTIKYLKDANDKILILLLEQEQSWAKLAQQAIAAFTAMGQQILLAWQNMLARLKEQWQAASGFVMQVWQGLFGGILQPIWEKIAQMMTSLWNEHFYPLYQRFGQMLDSLGQLFSTLWNQFIYPFIQNLTNFLKPIVEMVLSGLGTSFYNLAATIADFASGGILALKGICDFLTGVFMGRWGTAWYGVFQIFKGVWESMKALGKGILNGLIGMVNSFLRGLTFGVNTAVGAINKIRLDIPKWVPKFGGSSIGFHLPQVPTPQIPMLAKGGVIRQPTLAMMGEYKGAASNPEIAAPQSLLRKTIGEEIEGLAPLLQTMIELLREQNQLQQKSETNILLDGEQLYRSSERYRTAKGYPIGMNPRFR